MPPTDPEGRSTYRIVRMYQGDHPTETIREGLTLADARAHCGDPETSSSTATSADALARTTEHGPWFDGYEAEHPDTYQGWANRATWAAVLWARNDEAAYAWWIAAGRAHGHDLEALAEHLAEHMPHRAPSPDLTDRDWLDVVWAEVADACAQDVTP